jgi:inositol oxygenase
MLNVAAGAIISAGGGGNVISLCRMGAEPQWAVCGESFPVGCRFHPAIACSQFFSINPDRRRRIYTSPTGIYKEGCGLASVHMSWSASEYLYMVRLLILTPHTKQVKTSNPLA